MDRMKNKNIPKIQKQVAYIISIIGFLVATMNFITPGRDNAQYNILNPSISLVLLLAILIFITAFSKKVIFRYFQVFILLFAAFTSTLDDYDSIYGLGFIFLSIFLSFKYGFLEKKPILKLTILMGTLFLLIKISAALEGFKGWNASLGALLYLSMFIVISYIIYQDEIKNYIWENKKFKSKNKQLEMTIDDLEEREEFFKNREEFYKHKLEEIIIQKYKMFEELKKIKQPADISKITPAELKCLEALVIYNEKNKELAKRLNLSENTIKKHLANIMDKLGVDKRSEIIDMCKYNFGRGISEKY